MGTMIHSSMLQPGVDTHPMSSSVDHNSPAVAAVAVAAAVAPLHRSQVQAWRLLAKVTGTGLHAS